MKNNLTTLRLAFQIALMEINSANAEKHRKSKYTPFISAKILIKKEEDGWDVEISNCCIYAVYDNMCTLLRQGNGHKSKIQRDFASMNDAIDYFGQVLKNKCFK